MSELLSKITCPMGCSNPTFNESTKVINESNNSLLLEGKEAKKTVVKSYTCQCCGNTFEMTKHNDKTIL